MDENMVGSGVFRSITLEELSNFREREETTFVSNGSGHSLLYQQAVQATMLTGWGTLSPPVLTTSCRQVEIFLFFYFFSAFAFKRCL